jgi:hypothetical protein
MEGEPNTPGGVVSERQVRCALDVAAAAWLLEAKDLDGARRVLESVLATLPHDVRARTMLAQVLFRMRDFIAASELYERLLSEFRGDVALTFNLALSHLKSGRPDAAAAGLRRVLEARPDHARARVWLRVAEAATPALSAPGAPAQRASVRPTRLDDLPRVTLPPGAAVAQDATGVVSVRVEDGTRWLARPNALHGYEGDVAVEAGAAGGGRVVSISGNGTAFLRGKGALVVIELRDEETCVRASALIAYASTLVSEAADPEVVGEFDEEIVRLSGAGPIVLEVRAELVALPVGLTHATTVRWDSVIGWTGHVVGAPSDSAGADGRPLARFAGNGSLLLAMHDEGAIAPAIQSQEWYGRYQVLRRLEGTPTEEVLLARSHGPGGSQRKVILRRHLSRCDADSPFLQLLARETDAYAVLTHPGIVRLYDFLLLDGHPVLVLEYVSGVSLGAMDSALGERHERIGDRVAFYIAHGVFSALAAAHGAREPDTGELAPVIHRDVRAGNVLLGWNGDVKLGSFATAKVAAVLSESTDVRAAALLLTEMLVRGRAVDPSAAEAEVPRAPGESEVDGLESIRPKLSQRLRDALRAALAARPGGTTISAADIAREIEIDVDLPSARKLCEEKLGWLRESAFGGATLSSMPPPPVANTEDAAFFQSLHFPKPSPVPDIAPDEAEGDSGGILVGLYAETAPDADTEPNRESIDGAVSAMVTTPPVPTTRRSLAAPAFEDPSDTPPPIQPPSFGPGGAYFGPPRSATRRRRAATAIGICTIALVTGVATVDLAPWSGSRPAAATGARDRTEGTAEIVPAASHPMAEGLRPANALPTLPALAPAAPSTAAYAPAVARPATDEGILRVPSRAAQHRVFFDGRVIGEGAGEYPVRCGTHSVRVGSKGDELSLVVPCGGSVAVE